jgi:hypothetical protein
MAARTEIHFSGGELVVVEGAARDVAIELGLSASRAAGSTLPAISTVGARKA